MALWELSGKLSYKAGSSNHQGSILLVDIMNVLGVSKSQREIHIHAIYLHNVLMNILRSHDNWTRTITGSVAEGMCGGIYANVKHKDYDYLYTNREIQLCTPRTTILATLHCYMTMTIIKHPFLLKKMTTF